MKYLKYLGILVVLSGVSYALGPKVSFPAPIIEEINIDASLESLDSIIASHESKIPNLKPDNQARIVWANDSIKQKTEYSIVYLHGFSASQEEGDPVHIKFAKRYGFNLYLPRLEDHGRLDTNTFINLTPDNFIQSAEDAIAIGHKLGEKVIVMSCSTGGTLSAILAAEGFDIHSMIMYSPNIDIYDPKSEMLLWPWGKQMSKLVMGGEYNHVNYDSIGRAYWNETYHTNGLFALKSLIKTYMNEETFSKIKIPVFLGYYFKDEEHQDKVVSVERIKEFYTQIGTPENQKIIVAFPEAGHHVISSYVMSKDLENIQQTTYSWAEEVLGLKPIINN